MSWNLGITATGKRLIVLGEWHHRVGAAAAGWLRRDTLLTNDRSRFAEAFTCRVDLYSFIYMFKCAGCAVYAPGILKIWILLEFVEY